jgi:NADH dehydrogenase [ubiquinone] 1 alpha subcomplex assembly factor 5
VDIDTLTFHYSDMFLLMRHLQGMGENGAAIQRRQRMSRDTFLAASAVYDSMFGTEVAHDGGETNRVIPATFEVRQNWCFLLDTFPVSFPGFESHVEIVVLAK